MNTFSIREALKVGWSLFTKHWLLLIGVLVVSGVIENIPKFFLGKTVLASILTFLISVFFIAGMVRVYLDVVDGKNPRFADLFSQGPAYLRMLGALILQGIVVIIGFILLIVPGIYLGLRLMFVQMLVVDKGLGPIEALKASWKMTEGEVWHLFKISLVYIGLGILGLIALIVGLLVAAPIIVLMAAYVYRKLSSKSSEIHSGPAPVAAI